MEEYERDVLAVQQVAAHSGCTARLKLHCEVYEVQHFIEVNDVMRIRERPFSSGIHVSVDMLLSSLPVLLQFPYCGGDIREQRRQLSRRHR